METAGFHCHVDAAASLDGSQQKLPYEGTPHREREGAPAIGACEACALHRKRLLKETLKITVYHQELRDYDSRQSQATE